MKTHAKTHGLRRFLCGLTALATAALMVPMAAMAVTNPPDNGPDENGVTVGKSATNLDANNQTTVTLDIQAGSTTLGSDVVFVLDKSASLDIRQEAMNMLDELKNEAGTGKIINVGVVNFEKGVLEQLPLKPLTDENYETVKASVEYINEESSGTNIQVGLDVGKAMLDASSTADENKHLVLVTDGVGYLWGTDPNGENVYSIYSENASNGEENLYASHETIDWHHADKKYYSEFTNMAQWLSDYGTQIASDIGTYGILYEEGQYKAANYGVEQHQGQNTDWSKIEKFASENSYVPVEKESSTASAPDAAYYMIAQEWQEIASKYNAYAYADPRYYKNGKYAWAYNAISNLGDLGGYSSVIPNSVEDYDGMFDAVKNTILYTIENGTVTDIIGEDFNFAGIDTLSLSVNGDQYTAVRDDLNNTVQFYNPNGQEGETAAFTVFYTTDSSGEEVLTWEINEEISGSVSLSYKLNLDPNSPNLPTGGVSAKLPTNESACLKYTGTDNTKGNICFPEPTVTIGSEPEQGGGDDEDDDNPPVIIPDDEPTISIRKVWVEDTEEDRPDSILVEIYHDEELYDTVEVEARYRWRTSYTIPERYEDDDWWVQEADVPAGYEDYIDETRDNVFVITNTYVGVEEESSEESSEPSVTPSEPSVTPSEPSAPSSEPTSEPSEPAEPTLPQTGQVWWPVILLLAGGAVLVAFGAFRTIRGNGRRER